MEQRLEAYEDIIDSEVGDTAFIRARNIERETGLRQIFLKFEGGNPTGTQKDRVAFAQAMDALRQGNWHGSAKHGGVLICAGDDHNMTSTINNYSSELLFSDLYMPVLYPADIQEVLDMGLYRVRRIQHG